MTRSVAIAACLGLFGSLLWSCSSDSSLFTTGPTPTTSTGTTASGTNTGGTSGTGSTTGGTSGTGAGGTGGQGATGAGGTGGTTGGTGGVGGESVNCAHPLCEWGPALDPACTDCVLDICANDPFCCDQEWDNYCIDSVLALCGTDCGVGLPTCDDQYGNINDYTHCLEAPATCEFQTSTVGTSCNQLCRQRGGECFYVYNDQGTCNHGQTLSCDQSGFGSLICVCSRGCGGDPPCPGGEVCNNGSCQ